MKTLLIILFVMFSFFAHAQRVGINTATPQQTLSVKGTVQVDADNENPGTLDSASLRFGSSNTGIFSRKTGSSNYLNGMELWTGNVQRLGITSLGLVGIGNANPQYRLDVNGTIRSSSSLITNGSLYVDGSSFVDGNSTLSGYVGIGTSASSSYRLNVNGNLLVNTNIGVDGNARIDGNTTMGGTLAVDGKITNNSKGMVISNSSTTLRTGFSSGTFSIVLAAGSSTDITFIVTPFTGNNSNIRVSVSQFQPGSGASNWGSVIMTPHSVDPSDAAYNNQSTVKIRFHNAGSSSANLGTNAVLYLYCVVTN